AAGRRALLRQLRQAHARTAAAAARGRDARRGVLPRLRRDAPGRRALLRAVRRRPRTGSDVHAARGPGVGAAGGSRGTGGGPFGMAVTERCATAQGGGMRIVCEAHAKINWSLNVLGVREDGYHELDMLMQTLA